MLVSEQGLPSSTISVSQQSDARPAFEHPSPPHWPQAATQQALPLEDSIPGMPPALGHTSGGRRAKKTKIGAARKDGQDLQNFRGNKPRHVGRERHPHG